MGTAGGDLTKSLTADQMKAAGLTADTAQPITCAVCHNPHDEGDMVASPAVVKVRIEGSTGMLSSGFAATSVGKGAICITCHVEASPPPAPYTTSTNRSFMARR